LSEILFVQAGKDNNHEREKVPFQSLERDSVCSSSFDDYPGVLDGIVSISWARFCLFKLKHFPRPFGQEQSFNLLGEILSVQASATAEMPHCPSVFQSLERDSVCSSCEAAHRAASPVDVSIS